MMTTVRRSLEMSRLAGVGTVLAVVSGLMIFALRRPEFQATSLHFNVFAIPSGITALLLIGLFVYFALQPARTEERVWLTVYLACAALYALSECMFRLSATAPAALFWSNFEGCGILMPVALLLFALAYTDQSVRRHPATTSILLFATLMTVVLYCAPNFLFDSNVNDAISTPWGYNSPNFAPAELLFVWYGGLFVVTIGRLIYFRGHTRNSILRQQSLIFILAIAFPFVVGLITDSLLPALNIETLPPLGTVFFLPGAAALIFGIIRYQVTTINPIQFSSTVLSLMQEAVVATDDHLNIMYLNPQAEALLHIQTEGHDKASLSSVIAKHSAEVFGAAFSEAARTSGTITLDHIDVAPHDAAEVPVRVKGSRLKLDRVEVWVLALADITKELQTRRVIEHEVQVRTDQLHRAQSYLESSINSLEQGFVLVNREAKVELANGATSKLLGAQQATAGLPIGDIGKALNWDVDLARQVQIVLAGRHAIHLEAASRDGSFFLVFVTPIVDGPHVLGATIIIEDITEQKILNRSKDEFFSIASHELRTPLTAIRGNMDLIHEYFPDAMKDKSLARMVDDTHAASIRLIEIVNDFLDSSKLEQGKMEFNLAPIALAPLMNRVTHDLRSIFESRGVKVVTHGLNKVPKVLADENRLHQILSNLMSNSAKYGERVTITVTADTKGDIVRLHVADNGKGITPEGQKLLFHKFQQAGESLLRRDDTKGTGLGLYISRLLASNMKGNVELEYSEVGKGSTFVVTLPIAPAGK